MSPTRVASHALLELILVAIGHPDPLDDAVRAGRFDHLSLKVRVEEDSSPASPIASLGADSVLNRVSGLLRAWRCDRQSQHGCDHNQPFHDVILV